VPLFIYRFARLARTALRGWRLPLAVALTVFLTSWLAMWWAEPAGNAITLPGNYWWYFVVTASTVGYGDFYPETVLGHVVGAYVIVGGIVTLTILFTRLATVIQTAKGRRMKGLTGLDVTGHLVILGYHPGRTERLVDTLVAESGRTIVLCAWSDVGEHPMPEHADVEFVRGDLASGDLMHRACVAAAATVVIDARDDNEALAIAVAVDHVHPDVHLVAALRDLARAEQLRYVNPGVQCVQWHMPKLVTEEALDPGITQVYTDLMSSGGSGNTYSLRLPSGTADLTFGRWQTHLGERFGATVIAVRQRDRLTVSPPWDTPVEDGATLYYVGSQRIPAAQLRPAAHTPAQ
jgi:voltage-gated potassium channel